MTRIYQHLLSTAFVIPAVALIILIRTWHENGCVLLCY